MMPEIEEAFQLATKVLLGVSLQGIQLHGEWLYENHRKLTTTKSAISGKPISNPPMLFYRLISLRAVKFDEWPEIGKHSIPAEETKGIALSSAKKIIEPIRYYTPESVLGQNIAVEECSHYIDSSYCYKVNSFVSCKYCAYSFWPRDSEYLFGVDTVFSSRFCLKCYSSSNLTRCFEVANSTNCSDSYFCYNCDALDNCMFCFNTKSKRHAIGNVEYPREQYLRIKKLLLDEIARKIEKEKRLSLSIFNVGCQK